MSKVIGYALEIVGIAIDLYTWSAAGNGFITAGSALLGITASDDARRAKNQARDAYNASLKDRLQMVDRSPDQPRTLVYGRVRAVEGVRRAWVSGSNSEKLTMIISFAGHEIDGFETFYFNDVALTLDSSGHVMTVPFAKASGVTLNGSVTFNSSGVATFTLPSNYIPGSVTVISDSAGSGVLSLMTTSVTALVATISGGPPSGTGVIAYQIGTVTYTARIRSYVGGATQNVGADLAADYPGHLTSADKFAGIALAVVDISFDQDVYVQGHPNVTAVFRGKKVYDPRKDDTNGGSGSHRLSVPSTWEWSVNPALHAFDYARHVNGWNVPAAEINNADIIVAANVADQIVCFPVI